MTRVPYLISENQQFSSHTSLGYFNARTQLPTLLLQTSSLTRQIPVILSVVKRLCSLPRYLTCTGRPPARESHQPVTASTRECTGNRGARPCDAWDALPLAGRPGGQSCAGCIAVCPAEATGLMFAHTARGGSHRGRLPFTSWVNSADPMTAARGPARPLSRPVRSGGLRALDSAQQTLMIKITQPPIRPSLSGRRHRISPCVPTDAARIYYLSVQTRVYTFTDAGLGNCIALTYAVALACHRPPGPRSS